MMKETMRLLREGLIGAEAKIIRSRNKDAIGFAGRIADESRNMITIDCGDAKRRFIKDQHAFRITVGDHTVEIDGEDLVGRPEERIKKWLQGKITGTSASR